MSDAMNFKVYYTKYKSLYQELEIIINMDGLYSLMWSINYCSYFEDARTCKKLAPAWVYQSITVNPNILSKLDYKFRPINWLSMTESDTVEIIRTLENVLFFYKDYRLFDSIKRLNCQL